MSRKHKRYIQIPEARQIWNAFKEHNYNNLDLTDLNQVRKLWYKYRTWTERKKITPIPLETILSDVRFVNSNNQYQSAQNLKEAVPSPSRVGPAADVQDTNKVRSGNAIVTDFRQPIRTSVDGCSTISHGIRKDVANSVCSINKS